MALMLVKDGINLPNTDFFFSKIDVETLRNHKIHLSEY